MAPSPSADGLGGQGDSLVSSPSAVAPIGPADAEALLDVAEAAIVSALVGRPPTLRPLHELPPALHERVGAFVTLTVAGELNGCIGTLEGVDPLGHAVARLALSAAFADPRLAPLRPSDYPRLTIEVSLLSRLAPIEVSSRDDLLRALRPGYDGVVIEAGSHHGLFLPRVWQHLPAPDDFVDHLWLKAGLTPRTWPAELRASRFTTRCYERAARTRRRPAA